MKIVTILHILDHVQKQMYPNVSSYIFSTYKLKITHDKVVVDDGFVKTELKLVLNKKGDIKSISEPKAI